MLRPSSHSQRRPPSADRRGTIRSRLRRRSPPSASARRGSPSRRSARRIDGEAARPPAASIAPGSSTGPTDDSAIELPHSSYALYDQGRRVARSSMKRGRLALLLRARARRIYLGRGRMVHAPHSGRLVEVVSLGRSGYGGRLVGARRIAAAIRRGHLYTRNVETISFARGIPAPECLPVDGARRLRAGRDRARRRDDPLVRPGRRLRAASRLARRAARRRPVAGARHERLAPGLRLPREPLRPASAAVLVEAPTYDRPLKILRDARRATSSRSRRTTTGSTSTRSQDALDAAGAGVPLHDPDLPEPERADALDASAGAGSPSSRAEHDLLVYEDDPYGLVRFEGEAPPTPVRARRRRARDLQLVVLEDDRARAFASATSSCPKTLAAELEALAVSTYITPVLLAQATVYEFLRRGAFEPNLERVRGLLRERRDAMLGRARVGARRPRDLEQARGRLLPLARPRAWTTAELLGRAEQAGVTFVKGADFFPRGEGGDRSARLAFSFVSPAEIDEGVGAPRCARPGRGEGLGGAVVGRRGPRGSRCAARARAAAAARATHAGPLGRSGRGVAGEGAEAGPTEVAIIARWFVAACSSLPLLAQTSRANRRRVYGACPARASRRADENCALSGAFQHSEICSILRFAAATLPAPATPVENSSQARSASHPRSAAPRPRFPQPGRGRP